MVVCVGMMMRAVRRRLAASLWYVWAVVRMPLPARVVVFAVHVPLHLELPVAVGPELWRQAVRHCRYCFSELVCVVAWLPVFAVHVPLHLELPVAVGPELSRQAVRHCRYCLSRLVCVVVWLPWASLQEVELV